MASSIFFQGSISQAIAEAQTNRRILVVFISGEDEESLQLEQVTWQDPKVIEEIQRGCVALRIVGGSTDALNFSAIFPTRRVPTISVIGFTGAVLQQHEGYIVPEEFVAGLQQLIATSSPQLQNVAAAGAIATILSSAHLAQTGTTPSPGAEEENVNAATLPESAIDAVADCISGLSTESSPAPVESVSSRAESSRGKAGVATNLVEMKNASSSTSTIGETDLDNEALEAIKSAQKAKATSKRVEAEAKASEASAAKKLKEKTGPYPLQIRLTNNENIRGEFEATSTLRDVKIFVDTNRTDGRKSYSFVIPFPRKPLGEEDLDKSLLELELGPRSTVILVPSQMTSDGSSWSCTPASETPDQASVPAGGGSIIGRVLSYFNPFSYIRWGVSPANPSNREHAERTDWEYGSVPVAAREADDRDTRDEITTGYTSPLNGPGAQRSSLNQRKGWGANGNVHTLRSDEDEVFRGGNSYWNGNSTQFGGEDENKRD